MKIAFNSVPVNGEHVIELDPHGPPGSNLLSALLDRGNKLREAMIISTLDPAENPERGRQDCGALKTDGLDVFCLQLLVYVKSFLHG